MEVAKISEFFVMTFNAISIIAGILAYLIICVCVLGGCVYGLIWLSKAPQTQPCKLAFASATVSLGAQYQASNRISNDSINGRDIAVKQFLEPRKTQLDSFWHQAFEEE